MTEARQGWGSSHGLDEIEDCSEACRLTYLELPLVFLITFLLLLLSVPLVFGNHLHKEPSQQWGRGWEGEELSSRSHSRMKSVAGMVAKSSHKFSPKLVIIPSPKLSPIPADPQKYHPMGWNKKWQNCHMNFHQIRWSYHHLNYHQFRQIPPKITIMGEIKSDKIVTRIVTKFCDIFVTLILTISGSSPKRSPYWVNQ